MCSRASYLARFRSDSDDRVFQRWSTGPWLFRPPSIVQSPLSVQPLSKPNGINKNTGAGRDGMRLRDAVEDLSTEVDSVGIPLDFQTL